MPSRPQGRFSKNGIPMLEQIRHDDILELRLARPPVNALNPEFVATLRAAVEAAPAQGARGVILSGQPGMFSAGLDLPALLQLDAPAMKSFWHDFFALCAALARSPVPVVSAITGHSPAGGAVLALFSDYRVMASGPYKIGLNEVQVGIAVPEAIQLALRRVVGAYRAERLLVAGAMIDADEALRVGFVDELAEPTHVVTRSREWLAALLKLPPTAMNQTRLIARGDLAAAFADLSKLGVDEFVAGWFSAETQTTIKALVAKLRAPKAAA